MIDNDFSTNLGEYENTIEFQAYIKELFEAQQKEKPNSVSDKYSFK